MAMWHSSVSQPTSWADCSLYSTPLHAEQVRPRYTTSSGAALAENWAADQVHALSTRLLLPERPGSVVLTPWSTTCVRPVGSSTSAFVVIVDARRPADMPFYRRWPRFLRSCGADMEQQQLVRIIPSIYSRSTVDLSSIGLTAFKWNCY